MRPSARALVAEEEVSLAQVQRCAGTPLDPAMAGTFIENIDAYREEQRAKGKRVPE